MAQGSAVHTALAEGYDYKIINRKDPKIDDMLGVFETSFKDSLVNEVELSAKDDEPDLLLDQGAELIKLYREEKMPWIKPLAAEVEFNMEFSNKDYTLLGYIDLVDKAGYVHDHKVTKRTPSEDDIKNNQQLSTYSLGYRALYGKAEKGLMFDYLVRGKTPKLVTHKTRRTKADHKRFLTNTAYIMAAIEQQHFYCMHPATINWICSSAWCAYEERGYHKELYTIGVNKFLEKYGQ